MSLIGLTGAHGTGKSTIIREVQQFGVKVIESSLSRAAQKQLGWDSLAPAVESEENMWALQDNILAAMHDRDMDVLGSFHFTLVDRTPADVWAYVDLWIQRLKADGKSVDDRRMRIFKNKCRSMAARYTQQIIVPITSAVPFVAEQNRADLESRDYHEKAVCQFIMTGGLTHMVLMQTGINERAKKVATLINTLENTKRTFQEFNNPLKTN